jgi:hypothetical protein
MVLQELLELLAVKVLLEPQEPLVTMELLVLQG